MTERLFPAPVDERTLSDAARTVLEAIDASGPISANEAGRIAFRLRGYRYVAFARRAWVTSAGASVLNRLEQAGLVRRTRGSRWTRVDLGKPRSDLIGLYVVQTSSSTATTPKASELGAQGLPPHAHDTSANRHFSCLPGPVTSAAPDADRVSAAPRGTESYAERRTEPLLGHGERLVDGLVYYSAAWLGADGRARRRLRVVG